MRGQDTLTRRHRLRLGVLALSAIVVGGLLIPAGHAGADGNDTCKFNTFPTAPGGSSALSIGCFLLSSVGAAGNKYVIEDFPQAHWHTGSARKATASAPNVVGGTSGTCVSSVSAHFLAADINNGVSGTNIPSNTFINAIGPATSGTPVCAAGQARISVNLAAGQIALNAPLLIENGDGRTVTDATYSGGTMTSLTGHFCKVGLPNCGTKTDVGKTLQGTQIAHLATITAVLSNTQVTVTPAPAATCPAGIPVSSCQQVSLNVPTGSVTTTREVKDATFVAPNKVCSGTAGFAATDVQLPITSGLVAGTLVQKFPAADYITGVGAAGCPGGTTEATLHVNFVAAGANANVVIGAPNASAPANGTAVAQLNSELSVNPLEAPGEPACTSGILAGSALAGGWNNPGFFDTGALGSATKVDQQVFTAPPALGPMIAQLDYVTGQVNLAGYVVQVKAGTPHESDALAHYDVYFPALLNGIAVCPNVAGVASTFAFTGQSLASQLVGQPGDVRDLTDFPTGTVNGNSVEHIYKATALALTPELTVTSPNCAVKYPPVNGYACGGN
jgi:hypothetical protein